MAGAAVVVVAAAVAAAAEAAHGWEVAAVACRARRPDDRRRLAHPRDPVVARRVRPEEPLVPQVEHHDLAARLLDRPAAWLRVRQPA